MTEHKVIYTYLSTTKPYYRAKGFLGLIFLAVVLPYVFSTLAIGPFAHWGGSGAEVFQQHEYWRLVTMLFTHKDQGHLLSNLSVLLPFSYLLISYFGAMFVLPLALVSALAANAATLLGMPAATQLIGISGLSYWAVSAWLTLYLLIDQRVKWRRRWAYSIFISLVLLAPHEYSPEISYANHALGFVFGIAAGLILYLIHRKEILKHRIVELEEPEELEIDLIQERPVKSDQDYKQRGQGRIDFLS